MPLWGNNKDESADKPSFLVNSADAPKEVRLSQCTGATPDEIAAATIVAGHAGWTISAGGNDNVDAQREVLVAMSSMQTSSSSSSSGYTLPVSDGDPVPPDNSLTANSYTLKWPTASYDIYDPLLFYGKYSGPTTKALFPNTWIDGASEASSLALAIVKGATFHLDGKVYKKDTGSGVVFGNTAEAESSPASYNLISYNSVYTYCKCSISLTPNSYWVVELSWIGPGFAGALWQGVKFTGSTPKGEYTRSVGTAAHTYPPSIWIDV